MSDYEAKEFKKLRLLIDAAKANQSCCGIRLETTGHDPSASVTIEVYVLEKFLKQAGT